MRGLFDDLFRAFGLLTRLPFPQPDEESMQGGMARCVWAFPLVGAVVGAVAALAFFAAQMAGLGLSLSAGIAIAVQLLLTGALHEDGLADFADGLGGRDRDAMLAIMRDSRIGSFGVLALVMAIGLRWSAIASLGLHMVLAGLICSALVGRLVMALLPRFLKPARHDGLGVLIARPPVGALLAGVAISLLLLLLHLPAAAAAIALALATLAAGWIAIVAKRRAGGYTGDVLGTAGLAAETTALLVFAAL